MMKSLSLPLIAAGLLAACSSESGSDSEPAEAPAGNETPAEPEDEASATGFITPGAGVPDTAERDEEGVPRDDYGRPFDYRYLGRDLPAFSGTMVSGASFSSEALQGQWTLVDVWGLWCSDCMADASLVAELSQRVEGVDGLDFLSIHTPPSAARADESFGRYGSVEAFFEEKGYAYPTLIDPDAGIRDTLEIAWTPSYLLVAPDLTVQGFRSELSATGADDPVSDFLADIAAVQESYEPAADTPAED